MFTPTTTLATLNPQPQPNVPSQTNVMDMLDEELVLATITESDGNTRLAASRIATKLGFEPTDFVKVTEIQKAIPSKLTNRLPELKAYMEACATLELFRLMPILSKTLTENLSSLEPGEAVTAYMKLMELISKKTDAQNLNINVNDMRWKVVPRHLADIYAQLEAEGRLSEVIDGEFVEIAS